MPTMEFLLLAILGKYNTQAHFSVWLQILLSESSLHAKAHYYERRKIPSSTLVNSVR
jgi:hypothetical protein